MSRPTVAVIGASNDRSKYGNKSLRAHLRAGYDVYPVNPHEPVIEGKTAYATVEDVPVEHLERVTIYVPPQIGITLLDGIARKGTNEVWLNPGADAPEVVALARKLGLNIVQACSILAIGECP